MRRRDRGAAGSSPVALAVVVSTSSVVVVREVTRGGRQQSTGLRAKRCQVVPRGLLAELRQRHGAKLAACQVRLVRVGVYIISAST